MKDDFLSRAYRVEDRRVAAVFADPLRRRLVLRLIGCDRSVAELAELMRMDLRRVHYHVTQLVKLGLLAVVGTHARQGRAIKRYRAVADSFFVPEFIADANPNLKLQGYLRRALNRTLDRDRIGTLYCLDDRCKPKMLPLRPSGPRGFTATERWHLLQLSKSESATLVSDVEAILHQYAARKDSAKQSYLLHFAIAPSAGR